MLMNKIISLGQICPENSFEVLHASLAQKLTNLEFSTMVFSDVAIGHFGDLLSDLTRVSNEKKNITAFI